MATDNGARIRALVEAWRVEHDKQGAILEELETLLTGGVGIGEKLKDAERAFMEAWQHRYRSVYIWNYAKDRAQMKRLLRSLDVEELTARMARYIQNSDTFFTQRRHPFGLFVSTIVQHARANDQPTPEELTLDTPIADCKHVPPCASDRAHTKKRAAEMAF